MAIEEQFDTQHFLVASVNILLESIGELPIDTLEDVANVFEAKLAESALIEAKLKILTKGWDINKDTGYQMNPDLDGYIPVPPHILNIRSGENIIVRDHSLYNKSTQSRKFTEPVSCDIVWNLSFDTLPHALRHYITTSAARVFQYRMISDKSMHTYTREDETEAMVLAKSANGYTGQYNVLTGSLNNNFNVLR